MFQRRGTAQLKVLATIAFSLKRGAVRTALEVERKAQDGV